MPHFDWTVRPYDLVAFTLLVYGFIRAWLNHDWRIKIIEKWKDDHYHSTTEQDRNIRMLGEGFAKLTAVDEAMHHRIKLVEDWMMHGRPN